MIGRTQATDRDYADKHQFEPSKGVIPSGQIKLRIASIFESRLSTSHGFAMMSLFNHLADKGFRTALFCSPELSGGVEGRSTGKVKVIPIRPHHTPRARVLSAARLLYSLARACKSLTEYHPDIVHAQDVSNPLVGILAVYSKLILRKRLVVSWGDLWAWNGLARHFGTISWLQHSVFEDSIMQLADVLTVSTESQVMRGVSLGIPRERIVKVYPMDDISYPRILDRRSLKMQMGIDPPTLVFLKYFGAIETEFYYDWIHDFLKAMIRRSISFKVLVKHQDGRPLDFIKKMEDLPKDLFVFIGQVSFEELQDRIGVADFALVPLSPFNLIDSFRFPHRVVDILSVRIPILTTGVGEVGMIVDKYGCGVNAIDPENAAIAVTETINDQAAYQRMSTGATRFITENSADRYYSTFGAIFENCVKEK